jgi:hypothetical protein
MSLLTTSAASIHQVGAAAALAGSSPRRGSATTGWRTGLWTSRDIAANLMLSGGRLIEQHTIRTTRSIDQATDNAVRLKDVCVIGSGLTSIANIITSRLARREFPDGLPLDEKGKLAPDAPEKAQAYYSHIRAITVMNRFLAADAIGFTPNVNFNILRSYRPGTFFRLFT